MGKMTWHRHTFLLLSYIIFGSFIYAQDRAIEFPDIPGYRTLKCDFHIHTVFSDGSVWPDIRVQEAVKDGLDAISLTEHLEYQPHLQDIPHPDRNRSYEIAKELAKPYDLLVIRGAEITRRMPPGHANAIFISDANKLNVKDSVRLTGRHNGKVHSFSGIILIGSLNNRMALLLYPTYIRC